MVIESRTIVGVLAAFAIVGGGVLASTALMSRPQHHGSVEVQQVDERSWTVEVKELGATDSAPVQTASR